jgi:hypothetical protein
MTAHGGARVFNGLLVQSGGASVTGGFTANGTIVFTSPNTNITPVTIVAPNLANLAGLGALRIDSPEPDIYMNDTDGPGLYTTITIAESGVDRVGFGKNITSDFYVGVRNPAVLGGTWRDDAFVIGTSTGVGRFGYGLSVSGAANIANGLSVTGGASITGNVGIGTINSSYRLTVQGKIYSSDDIIAFSDARYKKEVVNIPNSLEKVMCLNGITYLNQEDKRRTGLLAQDVQKVLPEAVSEDGDGVLSIAYGNLVGLLVEAIKELNIKISVLETKLNSKE